MTKHYFDTYILLRVCEELTYSLVFQKPLYQRGPNIFVRVIESSSYGSLSIIKDIKVFGAYTVELRIWWFDVG